MSGIYAVTSDQRRKCSECGRWIHVEDGGVVAHSSRCLHKADKTVWQPQSTPLAEAEAAPKLSRSQVAERRWDAREERRLAKRGELGEEKSVEAALAGRISDSDAMNQDW